jgi:hypothetical protein
MQINVTVTDANNIVCTVVPPQTQTITIDRGVAGNGIVSIVPVTISTFQYLRITYTNGTVSDVGPLTSTAYTATSPITIVGNTISLATVPIASGGTGATTAATAIQNLLPSYTGNGSKRLGLNSGATALEWVTDGGGTVTSVALSGGTTGLTTTGGPITSSGTITLAGTLAVANGGTGVTSSSGVNSVVLRDANGNITINSIFEGYASVAAAGTTTVLTAASVPNYVVTGSGGQTFQLPDATTLPNGVNFTFNNNQSSGTIVVKNNSSTTIATVQSGSFVDVSLLSNSIAAGSWDNHTSPPSNASWSTNTLNWAGSYTNGTWNGNAVGILYGGTGQTTAAAAITALTGTQTSGYYLRSNGTNAVLGAIQAADVPTLNQNTTGTASNVTGTVAIANGGTGATTAATARTNLGATTVGGNLFTLTNPSAITFPQFNADNTVSALTASAFRTAIGAGTGGGSVTSVAATVPSFLSISNSPITTSGTLAFGLSGTALPTTSGGTGLTSFTANGVVYASSTSALATGSALTFNGSQLGIVNGAGTAILKLDGTSTPEIDFYSSGVIKAYLYAPSTSFQINTIGTNPIIFSPNETEQMRLTSTGLGIGVTSPKKKLTVSENSSSSTTPGTNPVIWVGGGNVTANTLSEIGFTYGSTSWSESNVPATVGFQLTSTAGFGKGALTFCTRDVTTDTAPTERMRIDSSGNLGLGVTPSAWNASSKAIQIGSSGAPYFSISQLTTSTSDGYVTWGGYLTGYRTFAYLTTGDAATTYRQNGGVHAWFNAPSGTAGNAITFTQAMTLDASGNLLVGSTSTNPVASRVNGNVLSSVGGILVRSADGGSYFGLQSSSGIHIQFYTDNGSTYVASGNISSSGSVTTYNVSSDYRLKEVIGAVSGSGERIDALEPIEYTWKLDGKRTRGFLAHKFQEVYADSVTGTKDAVDAKGKPVYQSMQASTSEVIADLVAEIQSLRKRLTALEGKA